MRGRGLPQRHGLSLQMVVRAAAPAPSLLETFGGSWDAVIVLAIPGFFYGDARPLAVQDPLALQDLGMLQLDLGRLQVGL